VVFLAISLPITFYGRNQRSGWILTSFPGAAAQAHNTLLGYTYLHGAEPVMVENETAGVKPVAFFSGVRGAESQQNLYIIRAFNGLFAAVLAPLVGVFGALVLVNWLSWAVCAWVAWKLSLHLFQDPLAALLAVILVAGGMGMIVHIGDYSAHLLSFASYYLGVYLLITSGVLQERRSLRTHLMLGAYFSVANLTYSNGLMLTALYILVAFRNNRLRHITGAVLLALTARPLWKITLTQLGADVPEEEAQLFKQALGYWGELIQEPILTIVRRIAVLISEFAFFDSPIAVGVGLFACFYLPRRPGLRWFGLLVLGIPLAMLLAWLDFNWSRGYLIYGDMSVWIYCWLGQLLAKSLRGGGGRRLAGGLVVCLIIGSHFAWSCAHFWHELGPIKAYMEGWRVGLPYFLHARTEVAGMTGFEPTPVLGAGRATLAEAGAWTLPGALGVDAEAVSFREAFARRLLPFLYLALLAATLAYSWPRCLLAGSTVLAACAVTAYLSSATLRTLPVLFDFHSNIELPPGGKLTYRIILAPSFLDKLRSGLEAEDVLHLYVPQWINSWEPPNVADVAVFAASTAIPVTESEQGHLLWKGHYLMRVEDTAAAVESLTEAGGFTLEMANASEEPVVMAGWQRRDLDGRLLEITGPADSGMKEWPVLPAVEFRLIRADGSVKLIGF
jgi:hypothetical protein